VNRPTDRNAEPYLGGADSVEKTTYGSDVHGAGVNDAEGRPVGLTAAVPHSRGLGPLGWVLLVLAVLVLAGYAAGLFT
jgi:hypothetical protein